MNDVILIVDDDPDFERLLVVRCAAIGVQGIVTRSIWQFENALRDHQPRLICFDSEYPLFHGWALAERIAITSEQRSIPTVMLVASDASPVARNGKLNRSYYIRKSPNFWHCFRPVLEEFIS